MMGARSRSPARHYVRQMALRSSDVEPSNQRDTHSLNQLQDLLERPKLERTFVREYHSPNQQSLTRRRILLWHRTLQLDFRIAFHLFRLRSEERRVGKESRSPLSRAEYSKKSS